MFCKQFLLLLLLPILAPIPPPNISEHGMEKNENLSWSENEQSIVWHTGRGMGNVSMKKHVSGAGIVCCKRIRVVIPYLKIPKN